jgi:hypothetical protein
VYGIGVVVAGGDGIGGDSCEQLAEQLDGESYGEMVDIERGLVSCRCSRERLRAPGCGSRQGTAVLSLGLFMGFPVRFPLCRQVLLRFK